MNHLMTTRKTFCQKIVSTTGRLFILCGGAYFRNDVRFMGIAPPHNPKYPQHRGTVVYDPDILICGGSLEYSEKIKSIF